MGKMIGTINAGIIDNLNRIFKTDMAGFVVPELYFSDEEPRTESYGDLGKEDILRKLEELRRKYEEKYPEGRDYIYPLTGPEAKYVLFDWMSSNQRNYPDWVKTLMKKVRDILAKEKGNFIIDAEYDSSKNAITVYSKAFEKYDGPDRDAAIRRTIAHEVFHAFHCYTAPKTYFEYSYESEVVREALADFYSYALCLDDMAAKTDGIVLSCSEMAAHRRHNFWEEYLFVNIPYPNAIFCMFRNGQIYYDDKYADCLNNGAIDRMTKILKLSKTDMRKAYIELVPEAFRKNPTKKYAKRTNGKVIISGSSKVDDIGFEDDDSLIEIWDIIKKIVKDNNISSLEELQSYIPADTLKIVRGRFITLESGEIISAYPQWRVVNVKKFKAFLESHGYVMKQNIELNTVIKVKLGNRVYTYLFDPQDNYDIKEGDEVICINRSGGNSIGVVTDVLCLNGAEYQELCDKIGYSDLSVAKRKPKYSDNQYVHFHYVSGGGFIVMDPERSHIEIDRGTCKVEIYTKSQRTGRKNIATFIASNQLVDGFFDELEKANWEDGPFYKTMGMDWPTWEVKLFSADGDIYESNGGVGDGPQNGLIIQKVLDDLLDGKYSGDIFGLGGRF